MANNLRPHTMTLAPYDLRRSSVLAHNSPLANRHAVTFKMQLALVELTVTVVGYDVMGNFINGLTTFRY
jgi:hypothetical protein